jgi:PAS domain S-box-containing protein
MLLYYLLALIIVATVLYVFYKNTQKVKANSELVAHTQLVLHKSDNVLVDVLKMETGVRGYLLTGEEAFLTPYYNGLTTMSNDIKALAELTKQDKSQQSRMTSLKEVSDERIVVMKEIIEAKKQNRLSKIETDISLKQGKVLNDKIRSIMSLINWEESRSLKQRKIESVEGNRNSELLFFLLIIFILAIFILVTIVIKNQKAKDDIAVELKQSAQYARSLIEASLDPLVTISMEGKITDVNDASVEITGINREKLIGTDFSNYFTEPDKAMEGYQMVFDKGFVADYPLTIKHQNGKLTDVLYNASVYKDSDGKVLGVFAAARDVTEQKLLSKYSLSLIEASLDPLITISTAGKITDMNEAKVSITGIERSVLTGKNFYDYFTEPQKAKDFYQEVFAKGFVIDSPLTFRHKNGSLTSVLFNGSVYKDDRGNVLGAVVVARDITDQKRFENELIEAKSKAELATQKAEESNKLKEAFLANMSHEIRTPMNAIIGFSDILSKRIMEEQEREYVLTIKSAGENLLTIINDILDISKIEAGMMTFEEHTFSVREIFKSLQVMLMEKAKEKELELIFECDENVPEILLGDNTRLTQIIINLVSNAIKFTPTGKIKVNATRVDENKKAISDDIVSVEFSVIDTGIGIPKDKLEHIFERFRQAESHTTRKYGGTGLGLSIAKQLTQLQGGSLTVTSEFGVGSTFSFRIPYRKSTDAEKALEITEVKQDLSELSKINILLVEDNQLNVKLIRSLFSEHNLKLEVAENGSIGVQKVKEGNFDIVLMDMEMPVMNGYEAATVIRMEMKSDIPIIAMTAHAMSGERERCLSLGMNDYLSKPINANLLFEKMYDLTINNKSNDRK